MGHSLGLRDDDDGGGDDDDELVSKRSIKLIIFSRHLRAPLGALVVNYAMLRRLTNRRCIIIIIIIIIRLSRTWIVECLIIIGGGCNLKQFDV